MAILNNYKLKNVYRLTSNLINHWQPKISLYKNKLFVFWIDKSEGAPFLYFISKNKDTKEWSTPQKIYTINIYNNYNIISTKNKITLFTFNNNILYYSFLKHSIYKIPIRKKINKNNEIIISWENNYPDIHYFAINISKDPNHKFFTPILKKEYNKFYIYTKNYNKLPALYFQLSYYDDLNIQSQKFNILLTENKKSSKNNKDIWRKISIEDIYDNYIYNKSYYSISYTPEIDYNILIYKMFFYVINQFPSTNNKFIKVFNLLNENIDFNRLIEGDKILLPEYWGNIEFIQQIKENLNQTLKNAEKKFNLKNTPYIYYIISNDLKTLRNKEKIEKNDFLIIINP